MPSLGPSHLLARFDQRVRVQHVRVALPLLPSTLSVSLVQAHVHAKTASSQHACGDRRASPRNSTACPRQHVRSRPSSASARACRGPGQACRSCTAGAGASASLLAASHQQPALMGAAGVRCAALCMTQRCWSMPRLPSTSDPPAACRHAGSRGKRQACMESACSRRPLRFAFRLYPASTLPTACRAYRQPQEAAGRHAPA